MLRWKQRGKHDIFRREGFATEEYMKYILIVGGRGEKDLFLGK